MTETLPFTSRLRFPESRASLGRGPPAPTSGGRERRDCEESCREVPIPRDLSTEIPGSIVGSCAHVRVAVRVRPLPNGERGIIEVAGTGAIAIRKEAATGGNEFLSSQQGHIEERVFDRVFGPEALQHDVFAWTSAPLVAEAVAKGRNATIFVHGATGAGKTYTMFGNDREHGIIHRSIQEVFNRIAGEDDLEVRVSFLEIYNEVVRDLLQDGNVTCKVLEDERRGLVKVSNLLEAPVPSASEALCHLRAGMAARTVESTAANSQSSRAHAVFTLTIDRVKVQPPSNGAFFTRQGVVKQLYCKICLIDLAGSERAAITHNVGSALKDGARINMSLLALANCIDALSVRRDTPRNFKKPPYRDSKLTLMLKNSLTGDGLVAMIANVHPGRSHFEDSNNTLEYAKRASAITRRSRQSVQAREEKGSLASPSSFGVSAETLHHFSLPESSSSAHNVAAGYGPSGDDSAEERCVTETASSSSLPPPTPADRMKRRRKLKLERDARKASGEKYPVPVVESVGELPYAPSTTNGQGDIRSGFPGHPAVHDAAPSYEVVTRSSFAQPEVWDTAPSCDAEHICCSFDQFEARTFHDGSTRSVLGQPEVQDAVRTTEGFKSVPTVQPEARLSRQALAKARLEQHAYRHVSGRLDELKAETFTCDFSEQRPLPEPFLVDPPAKVTMILDAESEEPSSTLRIVSPFRRDVDCLSEISLSSRGCAESDLVAAVADGYTEGCGEGSLDEIAEGPLCTIRCFDEVQRQGSQHDSSFFTPGREQECQDQECQDEESAEVMRSSTPPAQEEKDQRATPTHSSPCSSDRSSCHEDQEVGVSESTSAASRCGRGSMEAVPHLLPHMTTNTQECEEPSTPLSIQLVASLQSEKAGLDARLQSVLDERDALARDRRLLERENERLRAANLEKDRQIALLIATCGFV